MKTLGTPHQLDLSCNQLMIMIMHDDLYNLMSDFIC